MQNETPTEAGTQEHLEQEFSTTRLLDYLSKMGVPKDEVRPAALPQFNGESDEHLLAGGVTAAEAFELYQKYFGESAHHKAIGVTCSRISPATVAGRKVWLPDLTGREDARKHFRNQSYRLDRELGNEKSAHAATSATLAETEREHAQAVHEVHVLRVALGYVLFDKLEGEEAPQRRKFRRDVLGKLDSHDVRKAIKNCTMAIADWFNDHMKAVAADVERQNARRTKKIERQAKSMGKRMKRLAGKKKR